MTILETLERASELSPRVLGEMSAQLETIGHDLQSIDTPLTY